MTAIAGFPNVTAPGSSPTSESGANPSSTEAAGARPRSYTAGLADQLGERQLAFDSGAGTSIEVLHFKKEFSDAPAFEAALRARVESLAHLQHPSLTTVLSIERGAQGLSLVSKHVAGRRVSELVEKAHGPAFALELIRLVTPALAALQRTGDGVSHGVLSSDRIIVTRDGRLVVVEHVLGSAVASLGLSRSRLLELGLVIPEAADPVNLDGRSDMLQLGFVALSLLLGRHIDTADYPVKMPVLFDEFVQSSRSPILAAKMRGWLERAMQLSSRPFATAREAQDAFGDLPDDVDVRLAESTPMARHRPRKPAPKPAPRTELKVESKIEPKVEPTTETKAKPSASQLTFEAKAAELAKHQSVDPILPPLAAISRQAAAPARGFSKVAIGDHRRAGVAGGWPGGRAVRIAVCEVRDRGRRDSAGRDRFGDDVRCCRAGSPGDVNRLRRPSPHPRPRSRRWLHRRPTPRWPPPPSRSRAPVAAGPRFGGVTVTSSIDLQVFKDGKLVGSTSGPIAVNEGPHNLEFVNEALGFRLPQSVNVKGGQMTTVKIAAPNGRISINAVPWAIRDDRRDRARRNAARQPDAADRHARDRVHASAARRAEADGRREDGRPPPRHADVSAGFQGLA